MPAHLSESAPRKAAFSFPRFKQRTEPRIHPRIESARNKPSAIFGRGLYLRASFTAGYGPGSVT